MYSSFKYHQLFLTIAFLSCVQITSCMEKAIGFTFFSFGILSSGVGITLVAKPEERLSNKPITITNNKIDGQATIIGIPGIWLRTNTVKGAILTGFGLTSLLIGSLFLKSAYPRLPTSRSEAY